MSEIPQLPVLHSSSGAQSSFGIPHRLGDLISALDSEFSEQPVRVTLDRSHPHPQFQSDLRIRSARDDERADLLLPGSQSRVLPARFAAVTSSDTPRIALTSACTEIISRSLVNSSLENMDGSL